MTRAIWALTLLAASCTADNPSYCKPGPGFEACARERLNLEGPPDLLGYQIVPLPDMTTAPDLYQCKGHLEQCSDVQEVVPGACCGTEVCWNRVCRTPLHGACRVKDDCANVFSSKDMKFGNWAACVRGECLGDTGAPCSSAVDCASGDCATLAGDTNRCR